MQLRATLIFAFIALISLVSAKHHKDYIDTKPYKKELFKVHLLETRRHTVNGNTCDVEMIFIEGTISGEYFNGDLIFKDSTNVIKRWKDGRIEANARFFVNGTDNMNNEGHLHFEDILAGFDKKGNPVTRPNIFTDIENLAWIPKADVIGIQEEKKGKKTITYKWNPNNTTPKPYRPPQFPDETHDYTVPVLTIDVIPGGLGFDGFYGVEGTGVGKLGFTCNVNTEEFQGHSVDYFVDTRYDVMGQAQGVSARYIIEGTDKYGTPMKIYVENNGVDDNGDNMNVRTEPTIITDNPKWAWIETAPLHGTHAMVDGFSFIYFWTVEGANQNQSNEEGSSSESESDSESE